ncbi:MAG: cytochrome c [Paraburkholderia tropica]|uniref:Cytochrome c n=1 Tax=Paraburkholderia tropica TaxID=92647 RepID=A0ABX5MQC0_9BURK|nr:cytochrome c [Paraburkholderia tropica]MDE1143715.1 cytochrome c [Paraburkholderia tropica]PXX16932.1 cytochrome c [Paraburkholderia tropica]PZW83925.1 cytochrome c [Paraburkholderia tropica]
MRKLLTPLVVASALFTGACTPAVTTQTVAMPSTIAGIGTPLDASAIAAWDIDIAPDGRGLPPGSGDVQTGARVFAQKCAACHGAQGEGLIGDPLVGGSGTLRSTAPKRTVGSYWPYATTLFDYIRRAMPYNAPQSLSADEVYAVSAWILNRNGIVPDDARLDAHSLAAVRMPNRDGFVPDPRPGTL